MLTTFRMFFANKKHWKGVNPVHIGAIDAPKENVTKGQSTKRFHFYSNEGKRERIRGSWISGNYLLCKSLCYHNRITGSYCSTEGVLFAYFYKHN